MLRLHACFSPRLCFTQMCAFYVARAPFQRNIIFLIFLYHGWVLLLIYCCIFYYSFFRILRLNSSFFFFFSVYLSVWLCHVSVLTFGLFKVQHVGSRYPSQRLNPGLLRWELRVSHWAIREVPLTSFSFLFNHKNPSWLSLDLGVRSTASWGLLI